MTEGLWIPGKPISWAVGTRRNPAQGLRRWQESIGWSWRAHKTGKPLAGPVTCTAEFRVRLAHKDLTNLWKAAEDALKNVAFLDDDRVYEQRLVKLPVELAAEEGMTVRVEPYEGPCFTCHK
jgi:Holliday junction resolvase RusA-like endonuclease